MTLCAGGLLRLTWLRWGDPLVDLGREVEVPWRIASGEMLYRDMAYNYGPFSPSANALFLKVLGVHLDSIILSGLLSAGLGTWLAYRVSREWFSPLPSLGMAVVFVLDCVFQHYHMIGVFNFILPYSFPAVHGMLFGLSALLLFFRFLERGQMRHLGLAGLLAGFSALCKIETSAAILGAMLAFTVLRGLSGADRARRALTGSAAIAAAFTLVVLAGYLPFVLASSLESVVEDNLWSIVMGLRSTQFDSGLMGVADLGTSLVGIGKSLGLWAVCSALIALSVRTRSLASTRDAAAADGIARLPPRAYAGTVLALLVAVAFMDVFTVYRCLPLLCLVAAIWSAGRCRRAFDSKTASLGAAALFAFLAMGRILFNAGTYHFGFFMAVPALLVLPAILTRMLSPGADAPRAARRLLRLAVIGILISVSARNFLLFSLRKFERKTLMIETERGAIRTYPRARYSNLQKAIQYLASPESTRAGTGVAGRGRAEGTLLVMPEGAMVNFLTGMKNPTYFDMLIPPILARPGVEKRVIDEIDREAVDRVLLIDRELGEYGGGTFFDYAPELEAYLRKHYVEERTFGPRPFSGQGQGCLLLERLH